MTRYALAILSTRYDGSATVVPPVMGGTSTVRPGAMSADGTNDPCHRHRGRRRARRRRRSRLLFSCQRALRWWTGAQGRAAARALRHRVVVPARRRSTRSGWWSLALLGPVGSDPGNRPVALTPVAVAEVRLVVVVGAAQPDEVVERRLPAPSPIIGVIDLADRHPTAASSAAAALAGEHARHLQLVGGAAGV